MGKIVSIVGITASGKSALGIKLAQRFGGEIISADSRQVYRGLDIGTAKVTAEERALVPHHLLDVAEPGEHFDVYAFQRLGYEAIDGVLRRRRLPIIVGGTGLYSRSVVQGYKFGKGKDAARYEVLQICLLPPREQIRPLVEARIEARLREGMIEETRALFGRGVAREWLLGLGLEYFWNIQYIEGRVTIEEYKKNLATKTMQYAKRQRTWFKRERNTHFLTDPAAYFDESMKLIKRFLT